MTAKYYYNNQLKDLDGLHNLCLSLENPINIQLYNTTTAEQIAGLKVEYSENNKDLFIEDMYCIPSESLGYRTLSELEDFGYSLTRPQSNCLIYVAGDLTTTNAVRQPDDSNWETISY